MTQLTAFLAYVGPLLFIMLKVGVVIGVTGTALEAIGNLFKLQRLVAFGQLLEHVGADIPGVVDKLRKLFGAAAPTVALVLVFTLSLSTGFACSRLAAVNWPKQLGECAGPLDPGLLKSVGAVLAGTGDVESDLAGIVQSGAAADAVECAVAQLVGDIGLRPAEARESRQAERGRAFLAKVHQ